MRRIAVTIGALLTATGSPAIAADISDPVDVFVRALFADQRDAAKLRIEGLISQLNGTGPEVVGGPHNGLWHQRIVLGKALISSDELFSAIQGCSFRQARLLAGTVGSPNKVVEVSYSCEPVYIVKFVVRRRIGSEKVSLSDLGKDLITLAAPAAGAAVQ
ncbi:MAG: hypothetical protein QM676_15695 [Novosphingobium sp.]